MKRKIVSIILVFMLIILQTQIIFAESEQELKDKKQELQDQKEAAEARQGEVEEELDAHSEDFVAWRYYMETPGDYRMSPIFTFLLMNNLQSLSKALIEQHLTQNTM